MLELDTKILLFGLIVVCEFAGYSCFFPDPPAVLEPPNYKNGYQILKELSDKNAGTKARGMGKCGGSVYIFFNRPFVYMGEQNANELVYNANQKQLQFLFLDPMRVREYKNNFQLFSEVCGSRDYCNTFLDDIYFAIFPHNDGRCFMYVVDLRLGLGEGDHEIPIYDLHNQMNYEEERDFEGLKGIAFSSCKSNNPQIRFMYFGKFHIPEASCGKMVSGGLYSSLNDCKSEIDKQKKLGDEPRLVLTADEASMTETVAEDYGPQVVNFNLYRFGGCIDNFHYAVTKGHSLSNKEFEDPVGEYNWAGFRYRPFKKEEKLVEMDKFFNVEIKGEAGAPAPSGTPGTVVVVTQVGGEADTATIIRTVWEANNPSVAAYLESETLERAKVISGVVIIFVIFFCFLCVVCVMLTMRGRGSDRDHGGGSSAGSSAAGSSCASSNASSAQGGSSAASSARGGSSAASSARGGSSAASSARGGSSAANSARGGSSAAVSGASTAKGASVLGSSAKGASVLGSSAKGASLAASSVKGGSSGHGPTKGGSSGSSSSKGGSSGSSSSKGGSSGASSTKGGSSAASSGASSTKGGSSGASSGSSSAKGGSSGASSGASSTRGDSSGAKAGKGGHPGGKASAGSTYGR